MSKAPIITSSACVAVGRSACSIADHDKAQDRLEKSQDAYRTCLVAHTSDPRQCDTLKTLYESDKASDER
jgi:hypothetical protein